MPRYFFNVQDGRSTNDDVGVELPDQTAARQVAVRFTGELLAHHSAEFWNGEEWSLDVTDATGLTLFSLYFSAVIAPGGEKVRNWTAHTPN